VSGATVEIETADGLADSYLARPDHGQLRAGVLLVMDAFGLRPRIEEMADRIASHGYVVLAPNVFYRAGRAPVLPMPDFGDQEKRGEFMAAVRPLMAELDPDTIGRDGAAYLDFLAHEVSGRAGITGYCMGGRVGWRIAAAHPQRVGALASFHGGGLVTDAADSPHTSASRLRGMELYFGHADQDQSMSREQITALEKALEDAGVRYRSELYEGALHGYTMSDTAVYNQAATERHFEALFALLDRAPVGSER
jgi:carboxymethylenebutenolidase